MVDWCSDGWLICPNANGLLAQSGGQLHIPKLTDQVSFVIEYRNGLNSPLYAG